MHGLVCRLTDKAADFEENCAYFERDTAVKEQTLEEKEILAPDHQEWLTSLPEPILDKIRSHQSLGFAILGGFLIAVVAALLWATVTVITHYQIGFMAIGVGFLVGYGVRFFGAGVDPIFGFIGGFFALLGCVLGNLLSQVGFIGNELDMGYWQVLGLIDSSNIGTLFIESFDIIDLLFYGIAIFQGYKIAFRTIPSELEVDGDLTPRGSALRLPLSILSAVCIGGLIFSLPKAEEGEQTYFYDSGAVFSQGELSGGLANGTWKYFHENNALALEAHFENGVETGLWQYYDEESNLTKKEIYSNGLAHGPYISFHAGLSVADSGVYEYGRMTGPWIVNYPDGVLQAKGEYMLDRQEGLWTFFHTNGQVSEEGHFEKGERKGLWNTWDENGKLLSTINYHSNEIMDWLFLIDASGKTIIKNGKGKYRSFYANGMVEEEGEIDNGKKVGIWNLYHENGQMHVEAKFEEGKELIWNQWDQEGGQLVTEGFGDYVLYYPSGGVLARGSLKNGLRNGNWKTFFDDGMETLLDQTNYYMGQKDGYSISYYENGSEAVKGLFKNDKRENNWQWFDWDGQLNSEVIFKDDLKHGNQFFFNDNGLWIKSETYENGQYLGTETIENKGQQKNS